MNLIANKGKHGPRHRMLRAALCSGCAHLELRLALRPLLLAEDLQWQAASCSQVTNLPLVAALGTAASARLGDPKPSSPSHHSPTSNNFIPRSCCSCAARAWAAAGSACRSALRCLAKASIGRAGSCIQCCNPVSAFFEEASTGCAVAGGSALQGGNCKALIT